MLGLKGNMGAGKTSLVKCFIRALGVEEEVTSPTFNIVRTYKKEPDVEIDNLYIFNILLSLLFHQQSLYLKISTL